MELSRDAIVKTFPQSADGWERDAVRLHLEEIAAAVGALTGGPSAEGEAEGSSTRAVEAMLEAARAEAEAIRAGAADDARAQIAQARLAATALLERVAGLQSGVEEAQSAVRDCGAELASRLAQSVEPITDALRTRAEALMAEAELMAAGTGANPSPAVAGAAAEGEAELEPEQDGEAAAQPEPEPDGEAAQPEPEPEPEPEADHGSEPHAEADGDEQEPAGSGDDRSGVEHARLLALNMALGGTPRDEAERQLRDKIEDPTEILDEAYGGADEGR